MRIKFEYLALRQPLSLMSIITKSHDPVVESLMGHGYVCHPAMHAKDTYLWTDPLHGCLVGVEKLSTVKDQERPPGEVPEPDLEVSRVPSSSGQTWSE